MDELVRSALLAREVRLYSPPFVTTAVRSVLAEARRAIAAGELTKVELDKVAEMVRVRIAGATSPRLTRIVNASGTLLHTNLGRSTLADEAALSVALSATGAVNLELELATGKRGERDSLVEGLITELTGAEAACVVNNNAAAVLISLNTLAEGREVIISRGELVEIGGSFRMPDIIEKSGCILKEVGTTNRTHAGDYEGALSPESAVILKAHTSNYKVVGFTSELSIAELSATSRASSLPFVYDLGSGSLVDLTEYGLGASLREPVVSEAIEAGADIVTFSGDKLLGGPQAGIIAGRSKYIDLIKKNPLKRALRVDKMTMAALEATLALYRNKESLAERLPTLRHLTRTIEEIESAAGKAAELLREHLGSGYRVSVEEGLSQVGSGSLPCEELPTRVVAVSYDLIGPQAIFSLFLKSDPPILGRINNGRFLLDMRAIEDPLDVVPNLSTE